MSDDKKPARGPITSIFLILGLAFTAVGISTDLEAFSWAGLAFVLIGLGMAVRRAPKR